MATLVFAVGTIGTVLSLLVFASPLKTFSEVVKKKSTENHKGAPYVATFLCTSLWSFYGVLKPGGFLVAVINGAGAIFHCFYIVLFLIYSPQDKKAKTAQLVGILDVGFLAAVISVTIFAFHGAIQLTVLGTLCSGLTIVMYASPLLAMKTVIKTKSVECTPFLLSLSMFLNAGIWALYSLLVKDFYIGVPNFIGLILGSTQLTVYVIYKERPASAKGITVTLGLGKGNMISAMEMGEYDTKDGKVEVKVAERKALKRVKSLPKPTLNRQQTIQRVLKKALSFGETKVSFTTWTDQPRQDDVDSKLDWAHTNDLINPSPCLVLTLAPHTPVSYDS